MTKYSYVSDSLVQNRHDFYVGQRVQLHPASDDFMRGDRYGTVVKITRRYIWVRLDKLDIEKKFFSYNLQQI